MKSEYQNIESFTITKNPKGIIRLITLIKAMFSYYYRLVFKLICLILFPITFIGAIFSKKIYWFLLNNFIK